MGWRDDSENIKKSISKICGLRLYSIPPAIYNNYRLVAVSAHTRLPFAILSHVWVSNSWPQALFDIEIHYIDQEILICLWPIEIQILTSTYSYGKNSYLSAGTIDFTLAIEIRSESTEVQASAFERRKWFVFVCQLALIYHFLWHGNTLPSLTKDKI